jgi:hypothetical protein
MIKPCNSRSLGISIGCSLDRAYEFLRLPENFPKWASGLAGSLRKSDGGWVAETPEGPMKVRFSERNAYGVLDHWVFPMSGDPVYVPLRVVANGSGCELILTLFQLPGVAEGKFAADADWVMRDLKAAKALLESLPIARTGEANMKTLHFSVDIKAPREKVWRKMLDHESYKIWTAEFAPGSDYEGSWEKGQKIRFLAPDGSGMVSMIAENKPFEFISIKHLGFIKDGVEITESPEVKAWAPAFENYTLSQTNGVTGVAVDMDITPEYELIMEQVWPKALEKLKVICE